MDIIRIPTTKDLEYIAQALAEGEHDLGAEATAAGYALWGMWPTNDCPWGRVAIVPGSDTTGTVQS
jgi:hypothetical protein